MNKERHRIIPAAYMIFRKEPPAGGEILLQRRKNTGYEDGNYGLVSGHVEPGESFSQAIIRETKEEVGVTLRLKDIKFVHLMHRAATVGVFERADVFFAAQSWEGEIKNMEPDKCDDLRWFRMDALPENTIDYIRVVLGNVEKGIFYSEYGW